MANWPTSVSTDSLLYVAKDNLEGALNGSIDNAVTTITLADATNFPSTGFVVIDQEIIKYTGKAGNDLTGCTRGFTPSSAASHSSGAVVYHMVAAEHHNVLKDEIIAIEQNLSDRIGTGSTQISLPSGSATAPALRFQASNSGLYTDGSGNVNVATNTGTAKFSFWDGGFDPATSGNLTLGALDSSPQGGLGWQNIISTDGTVSIPAITHAGDNNTGIYYPAGDQIGLSTGGVNRVNISNSDVTTTVPVLTSDGSLSNTAHSFSADVDSGMYRIAANNIAFATGGVKAMEIGSGQAVLFTDGSVGAPGISFISDPDSGIYRIGANNLALSTAGVKALEINSSGQILGTDGSVSAPSMSFSSDPDSGLYRIGANNIALGTNGVKALEISSSQAVAIRGTATNDSAATGFVGEHVKSAISTNTNFPATGAYGDLTSISLTAGNWLVDAQLRGNSSTSTTTTNYEGGISTTSGNSASGLTIGDNYLELAFAADGTNVRRVMTIAGYRMALSSTTTVYLKYSATYSDGQPVATGRISATRIR